MTDKELKLSEEAVKFIKENKKSLIDRFANPEDYTSRKEPISIFMAGVPGAGKTEVAKRIIEKMKVKPVRIDADEIRELFRQIGYNGKNSYIFQKACSHGVDKLFDHVQKKKLHAIIDGTFATNNSIENVNRALGRDRKVFIYYIYQDPFVAWEVVKGRENIEGRSVPKEAFIDAYFKSKENTNRIKKDFPEKVELNLIIKNVERNLERQNLNVDCIDSFIKKIYNKYELKKMIL